MLRLHFDQSEQTCRKNKFIQKNRHLFIIHDDNIERINIRQHLTFSYRARLKKNSQLLFHQNGGCLFNRSTIKLLLWQLVASMMLDIWSIFQQKMLFLDLLK